MEIQTNFLQVRIQYKQGHTHKPQTTSRIKPSYLTQQFNTQILSEDRYISAIFSPSYQSAKRTFLRFLESWLTTTTYIKSCSCHQSKSTFVSGGMFLVYYYKSSSTASNLKTLLTSWARTLWARSKFGLWYTSERRLEGLCIHFLICCLLSVCNIFTTPRAAYHRPNLERAHKVLAQLVSEWTMDFCSRLFTGTTLSCGNPRISQSM